MQSGLSEGLLSRHCFASARRYVSSNNSPTKSNHKIAFKDLCMGHHPARRYTRSTKMHFEDRVDQIHSAYDIPDTFLSQNIKGNRRLRDRTCYDIRSASSKDKFQRAVVQPLAQGPVMPMREICRKQSKELETTKDRSFWNTREVDVGTAQDLEELFYRQVRFIQKVKLAGRNVN